MSETISAATMPTSFGVLKPVGHVMVGLPTMLGLRPRPLTSRRTCGAPLAGYYRTLTVEELF
jgi:hypothetical protein